MGQRFHSLRVRLQNYRRAGYFDPLRVAVLYAVFAGLWIVFSDQLIALLTQDKNTLSQLQTFKGLIFVVVTTILVWLLVHRSLRSQIRLIEALRLSQQRQQLLLNTVPSGIQESDLQGRITYSNKAHHQIMAADAGTLNGRYVWEFQADPKDRQFVKKHYAELVAKQPVPEVYITANIAFDGQQKVLEIVWDYLRDADGQLQGLIAVISDITLRKSQEKRILHLAYYDTLTNLPNRFLSMDRLHQMLIKAQRHQHQAAVLFIDLDDFKKINDSLGHETGDRLLIKVAERLRQNLRQGDTIGRLGGDEYIILLGEIKDADILLSIAGMILSKFQQPFEFDDRALVLTASVGMALYPQDGEDASTLLRHADLAMFYAKEQGRNNYAFYAPEMNKTVSRRLSLEQKMHGALERGEFYLQYQPLYLLKDNQWTGVEALLRWHNPELGQVSPEEFIPIAERTGLIVKIGKFVIETAIQIANQWQQLQPSMQIAINLSPAQFRDVDLCDFISDTLLKYPLQKDTLELEITEGVLLSGYVHTQSILKTLTDMQIKLSMDDFGTGYSSLSYLRQYPFKVLKIDRSFITDIVDEDADRKLVIATIAMSHGLGIKVVAEGVETDAQRLMLQDLGCDYAQGYFFSKPLPAEDITARIFLS
ncbi:MAG: EAL domain-containing protein [Methylophaga sp.]|nr:EAL domain-containing protein [Methylophaga sp.]